MTPGEPMRVLHVLDSFELGGAQQVALQLAAWSVARGCDVTVLGRAGVLGHRADPRVKTVLMSGSGFVGELRRLSAVVRSLRPHILHAHQRREALLCMLVGRMLGIPVVEHAHTYLPDHRFRAVSFQSRRIFAVSEQVRAMVTDDFRRPASRTVLVGNTAASTSAVAPFVRARVDGSAFRIVAVGRLAPQKDPLRFVRVVAAAAAVAPLSATWFGAGPMLGEARALAAALDAPVQFPGPTADVAAVLDAADALVMTSAWEGTPLVVLEAFARERLVVATEACGGGGVLAPDRAVVVPDGAADALFARELVTVLSDGPRAASYASAGRRYAEEQASPDAVFGPVLRAYRELCS